MADGSLVTSDDEQTPGISKKKKNGKNVDYVTKNKKQCMNMSKKLKRSLIESEIKSSEEDEELQSVPEIDLDSRRQIAKSKQIIRQKYAMI